MPLDRFLDIKPVAKSVHGENLLPEKTTVKKFKDAMDHQIIWKSVYHKFSNINFVQLRDVDS